MLLWSAFSFYLLSGIVAAISLLYLPYSEEWSQTKTLDFNYTVIMHLVLVLLQLIKFILLCCMRECVSFNTAVLWMVLEALLCLGFGISTLTVETILFAPLLSLGLSFMLFVWPLLTKHTNFIAHHLTEKEFHARLETMNRLQVEDALIQSIGCC